MIFLEKKILYQDIKLNKNGKNFELRLIHAYYYETKTRFDLSEKCQNTIMTDLVYLYNIKE